MVGLELDELWRQKQKMLKNAHKKQTYGTGDLLSKITYRLPENQKEKRELKTTRI